MQNLYFLPFKKTVLCDVVVIQPSEMVASADSFVCLRQIGLQELRTQNWETAFFVQAGEGRGSELCEPGGLRHQAGGASWRAPH